MTTAVPSQMSSSSTFPRLDPNIARLIDAAKASGQAPMVELDPDAARARVRSGDQLCATGPDMLDVGDGEIAPGLITRRYVPHRIRTDVVLVWFHGGGWVTGDLNYSDGFCRMLADGMGCEVHSVDYRLAPEHPFPAAVDDASLAVRVVGAGRRVIVAGDSAGANLAAVCAQQLRLDPSTDIAGQILVYPVLDADIDRPSYVRNDGLVIGRLEMTWFFDHYVPNARDRSTPRFAPLRAARLDNLAPAVIAVAGHDPLYDEGVAYARRLEQAGVAVNLLDFESLVHGFLRFTGPAPAALDAAMRIVVAAGALTSTRG
jgi:acetyl esterase